MPPPSPAEVRAIVETLLTDGELEALEEFCAAAGVSLRWWSHEPAIARPFLLLAWRRLAASIAATDGMGITRAQEAAALRLDVPVNTLRSWARRWARRTERRGRAEHGALRTVRADGAAG